MYCLKCKKHTETIDNYETDCMTKGKCKICNSKKCCFKKKGSGMLNTVLNKIPMPELHLKSKIGGEQIPGGSFNNTKKYSYCGPYTKLDKRLKQGYKGINKLDEACRDHDIAYTKFTDTTTRNKYDDILAARALQIASNPDTPAYLQKNARSVASVMATKAKFGMGLSD